MPASLSGGACTVFDAGKESYGNALANSSAKTRRLFQSGNSFFSDDWQVAPGENPARDGLGPFFHSTSCFSCHDTDGRGVSPVDGELLTSLLLRISVPGKGEHGGPKPDPIYGLQFAVQAVPGAEPEGDIHVTWQEKPGVFTDGEIYSLRKPSFTILNPRYGPLSENLLSSARLSPPVFGLGLLEAVPEEEILEFVKSENGISGRPNYIWDSVEKRQRLGRMGWKANVADLKQQTAEAFLNDLGIRSSFFPAGDYTSVQAAKLDLVANGGAPEISNTIFDRVLTYMRGLAPPGRREMDSPEVMKGESIFRQIQCAACHREQLHTGISQELTEVNNQTIYPYTDLLLHDMGDGLADNRPDFEATGSEWRTTPLWGIGMNNIVNGNDFFLHDGRARNLTEAILWHGGESEKSREDFKALPKADREALLRFLGSL